MQGKAIGKVPYGYVRDSDSQLQVDPNAAPMIRECFRMLEAGASLRAVAQFLKSQKVAIGGKAGPSNRAVARLVRNPILKGLRLLRRLGLHR